MEPAFDAHEYPTEETLKAITEWPYLDPFGLAQYVIDAWHWDNMATLKPIINEHGKGSISELRLATGGWSGNESILGALEDNTMFYTLYWEMSKRGGLVIYHLYKLPEK